MDILLFDKQIESARFWKELARSEELTLESEDQWRGIDRVNESSIVILDQSAVHDPEFANVATVASQSRPLQVFAVTGERLTVELVTRVMRAGVDFVFPKPFNPVGVEGAFPEMLAAADDRRVKREEYRTLRSMFGELTKREQDVLDYVLQGVPNKKTAEELSVSVRTIEARRAKVYLKTQSSSLVELVRKVDRLNELEKRFDSQSQVESPNRELRPFLGRKSSGLEGDSPSREACFGLSATKRDDRMVERNDNDIQSRDNDIQSRIASGSRGDSWGSSLPAF